MLRLIDIIDRFIPGDWGEESPNENATNKVRCIRGADIVPIKEHCYDNIPIRYVNNKTITQKLLQEGDIVIEKSGGSPTQSTGRIVCVTKELLDKVGAVVCSNFCVGFRLKKGWNPNFIKNYIENLYNAGVFFNYEGKTSGLKNLQVEAAYSAITIKEISFEEQKDRVKILETIDKKIANNRIINCDLEAMAKQLYDYWFVQFDFPNAEGKPYKSSGGKMVWNETLKREIPEGWNATVLSNVIRQEKSGDWGKDSIESGYNYKVSCIRGADFKDTNYLPTRYIQERNATKELQPYDVIVEISGGSPTQATGRCIYITKELVDHYDGHIICSNFCQPLTCDNEANALFMYFTWCLIYDNDNMFHYEGKTSGIKNFQMDTFLSESWIMPDKNTLDKFKNIVSPMMSKIAKNNFLNKDIQKQRDTLLPLLMNGQVTIKQ